MLETESFHDAGDSVVVLMRQRARSKSTRNPVEMSFAQIWTLRDGKTIRMEMYADPAEALAAAGLSGIARCSRADARYSESSLPP